MTKKSADDKEKFYKRFIDDMVVACLGTQEEAASYVECMNTVRPRLRFTYDWSNKELTYLYVRLIITEERKLETDRFIKLPNLNCSSTTSQTTPSMCFRH